MFMETKANRKRKKHTEEFKREAVRLLENRGERTVSDIAASLAIAENLLHAWKRKLGSAAERGAQGAWWRDAEDELKRLRREIAQLRQERDILKNRWPSSRGTAREPVRAGGLGEGGVSVSALCEAVGVSRSAYYAWCDVDAVGA